MAATDTERSGLCPSGEAVVAMDDAWQRDHGKWRGIGRCATTAEKDAA